MGTYSLGKLSAIIAQKGESYFDRELSPYGIGWGQQFLLLRIHENKGTSIIELAKKGFLDQSTTTRAVQKLEHLGYLRCEVSESDRRIRKLFTTDKAQPVIEAARNAQINWNNSLVEGMSNEEITELERLMKLMAKNAYEKLHGEDNSICTDTLFKEQ